MKVLLIADRADWILGKIANEYSQRLAGLVNTTVLLSSSKHFVHEFARLQPRHDVIHFLSPWQFYLLSNRTFRPVVLTLWHMVDWHPLETMISRVDTVCVGSHQWLERTKERVPAGLPVLRLPIGLDVKEFRRNDHARLRFLQANKLSHETIVLGFAGSAFSNESNRKGLDRLWFSLEHLKNTSSRPFILRMIGKGWSVQEIPESVQDDVSIEGFIPDESLPEYYSSLDYYLCTSRIEGVPYPVFEAMSCGAVVLSTAVGLVPEIVQSGKNGFILPESETEPTMVEIMVSMMDKEEDRRAIGRAAREEVSTRLSWETSFVAADVERAYESAKAHFSKRDFAERATIGIGSRARIFLVRTAHKKATLFANTSAHTSSRE